MSQWTYGPTLLPWFNHFHTCRLLLVMNVWKWLNPGNNLSPQVHCLVRDYNGQVLKPSQFGIYMPCTHSKVGLMFSQHMAKVIYCQNCQTHQNWNAWHSHPSLIPARICFFFSFLSMLLTLSPLLTLYVEAHITLVTF